MFAATRSQQRAAADKKADGEATANELSGQTPSAEPPSWNAFAGRKPRVEGAPGTSALKGTRGGREQGEAEAEEKQCCAHEIRKLASEGTKQGGNNHQTTILGLVRPTAHDSRTFARGLFSTTTHLAVRAAVRTCRAAMELTYKAIRQPGIPPTAVISAPGLLLVGSDMDTRLRGSSFMPNLEARLPDWLTVER